MSKPSRAVFDVVTDFLANQPSDEELLAYQLPPEQQARLDELLVIDTNSRLTAVQREELGDFRFVEDVMARVKVKIKRRLEQAKRDKGAAPPAGSAKNEENGS